MNKIVGLLVGILLGAFVGGTIVFVVTYFISLDEIKSSFKVGDVVVLKKTTELVLDWDAPELNKPDCYPMEGSRFKITDFSSVNHGSFIESSSIAWLESINIEEEPCEGWAFIDNLKKIKK
jgi:hypothetical protein